MENMNEDYHNIELEIENEININAPELHNGGDLQWKKQGFRNQEDFDCHVRRSGCRYKSTNN